MKKYILPLTFLLFMFSLFYACKKEEGGDQNKPYIILEGYNPTYWPKGETYVDPGAVAFDITEAGDTINISDRLQYKDNVNVEVEGDYEAKYNVTDEAGNAADEKTRMVKVLLTK